MNIRKFAIFICAVFFLGNCSQEESVTAPHSAPQKNPAQSAAVDPSHCMGRELLDTWAYYASAGPTFVMALSGKGDTQPIAKPYFNAEIKTALRNFKSGKRDDNTGLDHPAYWSTDKKTNILHTQLLPAAYLAMCTQDMQWAKTTLLAAEKLLKKNPDTFLLQRFIWEIKLFIGLTLNKPELLWALLSDIDAYVAQHAKIDPYAPYDPLVKSATDPIENTRLLAFIARTRSRYSLMANDYTNFLIAQEEFVIATGLFKTPSRTPLHKISDVPIEVIYRIGRASAAHHWAESLVLELQLRPLWLRKPLENINNYQKRMKRLGFIKNNNFCPLPVAKKIHPSADIKKRVLQCKSNKQIHSLILKKKYVRGRNFFHATNLFSKIMLFEDNRHFWGQHQYLRYQFFKNQIAIKYNEKNREGIATMLNNNFNEFCSAKRAYDNAKFIFPLIKDPEVETWCKSN